MHRSLGSRAYVRLLQDTIPERLIFVYKYFTDDLLSLAQMDLPIALTKRILKDTLRGLAVLHHHNIVHTVQLADIEDSAHVSPGYDILGKQVGNWMWRSPEAHAQGRVNKPSDMFSFGVVCIYAVLKRVIFAIGEDELREGEEPLSIVLERQISYFADEDGLNALLNHLGNSPWCAVLKVIKDGFNKINPRKPFSMWQNVDADFKDLIGGLTNFDPAKRLTAQEALAHIWFRDL
ncbi:MAG: hypothetical protein LQ340_002520 [Diploschistes diacapsis]|nr:MAG: hypothetical protein LQ340_002520 [Diploschistes diacapsis]